jgi:copper chaperone NosL
MRNGRRAFATMAVALLASGCAVEPQPVQYGVDACAQCRMVVAEPGFASQALTRTGKAYTFDSIECLGAFLAAGSVAEADLHSTWVQAFAAPERWLRADEAAYVAGGDVRSPMGAGITAHPSEAEARGHAERYGGELLAWDAVRTRIGREGSHAHAH